MFRVLTDINPKQSDYYDNISVFNIEYDEQIHDLPTKIDVLMIDSSSQLLSNEYVINEITPLLILILCDECSSNEDISLTYTYKNYSHTHCFEVINRAGFTYEKEYYNELNTEIYGEEPSPINEEMLLNILLENTTHFNSFTDFLSESRIFDACYRHKVVYDLAQKVFIHEKNIKTVLLSIPIIDHSQDYDPVLEKFEAIMLDGEYNGSDFDQTHAEQIHIANDSSLTYCGFIDYFALFIKTH
jgi:hypothetical protein